MSWFYLIASVVVLQHSSFYVSQSSQSPSAKFLADIVSLIPLSQTLCAHKLLNTTQKRLLTACFVISRGMNDNLEKFTSNVKNDRARCEGHHLKTAKTKCGEINWTMLEIRIT